ncbi:MAG: 16S rRNA (cytidine(1402)-2'-O)-methyltransferase [Polyangia bacterium]
MTAAQGAGELYVVGTPIGNLEDVTLRALRTLREASVIAAEDTRVTLRLLAAHDISTPCTSLREQNAARAVPHLVERLLAGEDVALVSDAGTPAISDPGEQLVRAAAEARIAVRPIPGPSALAAALSVAGLPVESARFVGFLHRSGPRRRRQLASVSNDPSTTVIYESPPRLADTLRDLSAACGKDRRAVVLRELTKLHEQIDRGTLSELAERFAGKVRGEITLVVAGAETRPAEDDEERLRELVSAEISRGLSARDASSALSKALGVPRKKLYEMAVSAIAERND